MQSPASGSPLPICNTNNNVSNNSGNNDNMAVIQQNNSNVNSSNAGGGGGPNTVLRVIVESQLYPVSLEVLHQIFQRFGKVLKIVTFTKNNTFQV